MGETIMGKAVKTRSAALALSPATLEDLENDVSVTGGLAYGYLAQKAAPILDGSRSANPLAHGGHWAFDIDDFVLVTAIPYGMGANYRDAKGVLEAALKRALQLAEQPASPSQIIQPKLDTYSLAAKAGTRASRSPLAQSDGEAGARARMLDSILGRCHYTAVPAWLLDADLGLTVSERILLADVLDVCSGGNALSYAVEYGRVRARTGLRATTAAHALRGLCALGILSRVPRTRGRYTLSWDALASFARRSPAATKRLGAAMTEADVRRRLADRSHSLAVPNWALELCGATEAALLLSKGWAMAHGKSDGTVWASGATLSTWLPGCERSLRRARATLADEGLVLRAGQYSYMRRYANGLRPNHTVEFRVDAGLVARALLVRGFDFGRDATAAVMSLFEDDATLRADAARWDNERADRAKIRRLRGALARQAVLGSPAAMAARALVDHGSRSRTVAPWRTRALAALPPAPPA